MSEPKPFTDDQLANIRAALNDADVPWSLSDRVIASLLATIDDQRARLEAAERAGLCGELDVIAYMEANARHAIAERDDLLWLVGHLMSDAAAIPPRLAPLMQEAHDRYDPTRYTLDYWEPS